MCEASGVNAGVEPDGHGPSMPENPPEASRSADTSNRENKIRSWLRRQLAPLPLSVGLLLGFFLHELVTPITVNYITTRMLQQPSVAVNGVLPILIYSERGGPPAGDNTTPSRWSRDKFVFILKLQNTGPSPARVGVGQISGCASMPSDIAAHIFGQPQEGRNYLEVAEEAEAKWGNARQKIVTTGSPREVYEVPAFSSAYVPIQMSLPIQFGWLTSQHIQSTVAIDGDCDGVETHYDPSALQLFKPGRLNGRTVPAALHEDFSTGNLHIEVQIGNALLRVDPALLKPLKRVPTQFWTNVQGVALFRRRSLDDLQVWHRARTLCVARLGDRAQT